MKLLTATTGTQGQRESDFAWCTEGEIVNLPQPCDRDRIGDPDGGCGCGRAFIGLHSRKGTTTAMVRDLDGFTLEDLAEALRSSRDYAGFGDGETGDDQASLAAEQAALLAEIAAGHDVGAVLECRIDEIGERS